MKNNLKIIIAVIIIIAIGALIYYQKSKSIYESEQQPVVTTENSIVGCYVAKLGKDIYSLNIASQSGESVKGTLVFKNFEKDSSSGTFEGAYKNGILLGDYSFRSEGMDSIMQVIFKRSGNDFIRGYGPMNAIGDRFASLNDITYDPNQTFKASLGKCATSLLGNSSDVIGVGETKTINGLAVTFNTFVQDSRCPVDVTCIQAGAVVANVTLKSGDKSETFNMSSDEVPHTFAGYEVSITDVSPPRISNQEPDLASYRITFRVEKILK